MFPKLRSAGLPSIYTVMRWFNHLERFPHLSTLSAPVYVFSLDMVAMIFPSLERLHIEGRTTGDAIDVGAVEALPLRNLVIRGHLSYPEGFFARFRDLRRVEVISPYIDLSLPSQLGELKSLDSLKYQAVGHVKNAQEFVCEFLCAWSRKNRLRLLEVALKKSVTGPSMIHEVLQDINTRNFPASLEVWNGKDLELVYACGVHTYDRRACALLGLKV